MGTPDDVILNEPWRFSEKIPFEKIDKAKIPQKEFLKQMEKRWNQKAGLQLWRHFVDKYKLINAVYHEKYQKDLDKELTTRYFDEFKEKAKNYQKRIEIKIKKLKDQGKKITPQKYTKLQTNFIKAKKDMSLYWLASEFNRAFKTKLTRNAIRDKRLRVLGKK